jgi:hypothetical protein
MLNSARASSPMPHSTSCRKSWKSFDFQKPGVDTKGISQERKPIGLSSRSRPGEHGLFSSKGLRRFTSIFFPRDKRPEQIAQDDCQ